MNLTIFDLDNTLLGGDSDHAWGEFLSQQGIVDQEAHMKENDRFYREYEQQTIDILAYQRFVLKPLIGMSQQHRDQLHKRFMTQQIEPIRLAKADALIAQHKAAGDVLLVITATNRFIAGPIVTALGIDNILATEPEMIDGVITGHIIGTPCFQEGKITRLKQWLQTQSMAPKNITFYSDSINDKPLMEFADKAVAVDPDDKLKAHAKEQNWPVISLRD